MNRSTRNTITAWALVFGASCHTVTFGYVHTPDAAARIETLALRRKANTPTITILPITPVADRAYIEEIVAAMLAFSMHGDLIAVADTSDGYDMRAMLTMIDAAFRTDDAQRSFPDAPSDADAEVIQREQPWLPKRDAAFLDATLRLLFTAVPTIFAPERMGSAWLHVLDESSLPVVGVGDAASLAQLWAHRIPPHVLRTLRTSQRDTEFGQCRTVLAYFTELREQCRMRITPQSMFRTGVMSVRCSSTVKSSPHPALCRILALQSLHPLGAVLQWCANEEVRMDDVGDVAAIDWNALERTHAHGVIQRTLRELTTRGGHHALLVMNDTLAEAIERAVLAEDVSYEFICVPHGCTHP